MHDPQTFWLTLTNIALGVAALSGILAVTGGVFHEFISRWRTHRAASAELEADFQRLLTGESIPTALE